MPDKHRILDNKVGDYLLEKKLGQGTYGAVYTCIKTTGENEGVRYAIKIMFDQKSFMHEQQALKMLSDYPLCHPYIACMYDYGVQVVNSEIIYYEVVDSEDENGNVVRKQMDIDKEITTEQIGYIVSELMDSDLFNFMRGYHKGLPDALLYKGFYELLTALKSIFNHNLSHRDIKPGNILIKGESLFKIGDLGLVCIDGGRTAIPSCTNIGTLTYVAPEVAQKYRTRATAHEMQLGDIWSLGVVFYEMVYGKTPFEYMKHTKYSYDDIRRMISSLSQEAIILPPREEETRYGIVFRNIIDSMLKVDPNERASPDELLRYLQREMEGGCDFNTSLTRESLMNLFGEDSYMMNKFLGSYGRGRVENMSMDELCLLYKSFKYYIAENPLELDMELETFVEEGAEILKDFYDSVTSPIQEVVERIKTPSVKFSSCSIDGNEVDKEVVELFLSFENIPHNPSQSFEELCDMANSISKEFTSIKATSSTIILRDHIEKGAAYEVEDGLRIDEVNDPRVQSLRAEEEYMEARRIIALARENQLVLDYNFIEDYYKDLKDKLNYALNEDSEKALYDRIFYARQLFVYEYMDLVFIEL